MGSLLLKNDNTTYIDLHPRNFDTCLPSDKGLMLTWNQWLTLTTIAPHLEDSFGKLKTGEPLHLSECLGDTVYVSIDEHHNTLSDTIESPLYSVVHSVLSSWNLEMADRRLSK
jgi:hypothetical protein